MASEETCQAIDGIADMLDASGREVNVLRSSIEAWSRLIHAFAKYPMTALIQRWYVDHLLAGCRRQLDRQPDVASIQRALLNLTTIVDADSVVIDDYRAARGIDTSAWLPHPQSATSTSASTWLAIDLARMSALGDDIRRLATRTVAHRIPTKPVPPVTADEIELLLQELAEIHSRWSEQLRGVAWAPDIIGLESIERMALALDLFNWQDFVDAEMAALQETGRDLDLLRSMARVSYHFDGARLSHKQEAPTTE